jgi:hypothetical protein
MSIADRIVANVAETDALDEIVGKFWACYIEAKMFWQHAQSQEDGTRAIWYADWHDRYMIDDDMIFITSEDYEYGRNTGVCITFKTAWLDDYEAFDRWVHSTMRDEVKKEADMVAYEKSYNEAIEEDRIRDAYAKLEIVK